MSAMHPAVSSAFPTSFAHFGQTLGPPCADATPLSELLAATRLPSVAARYAASFPGAGKHAALSSWSQYYLLALVPCATAAALAAQQDLPVALDGMGAVLTERGQPCRLCVPHGGCDTVEACPVRRLAPLLRYHLDPLSEALSVAGLSKRIFWSNAAAVLAWSLGVIAAPEADRAAIRASMCARDWADGGANPFRDVVGADPARRRVCCLRFRLGERCGDCPTGAVPQRS